MRIIPPVICLTLLVASCNSEAKKEAQVLEAVNHATKFKGENVGTRLDEFVKTFLQSQPDIRNNNVAIEKAEKEFPAALRKEIENGILDGMVFSCLGIDRHVINKKISTTFSTGVTSKDSTYTLNVFVDANLNENTAMKLKDYAKYKIQGKITWPVDRLAVEYGDSEARITKEINKTTSKYDCIVINVHDLKIDLQGFTEVSNEN